MHMKHTHVLDIQACAHIHLHMYIHIHTRTHAHTHTHTLTHTQYTHHIHACKKETHMNTHRQHTHTQARIYLYNISVDNLHTQTIFHPSLPTPPVSCPSSHLQVIVAAVCMVFKSQCGKADQDVVAKGDWDHPHAVTVVRIVTRVTRAADGTVTTVGQYSSTHWNKDEQSQVCAWVVTRYVSSNAVMQGCAIKALSEDHS